MLTPLAYERVSTFSDPSQGPGGQIRGPGDGAVALGAPAAGPVAAPKHKLHPLHWLVDGHWLGPWRTPLLLKLWRYGAGSIVAFVTSVGAVWVCFSWLGLGAITSSTIGFFAGAVPNWALNRRWAWQKRGREGVGRETSLYVTVSLLSWLASTAVTKLAASEALHSSHLVRDLLVTGSYTFTIVVLTVLKYVAYDRWVFVDRGTGRRSRHQVPSTTEQNLIP